MTTQLAIDTELSAVNSILGSIGQSPITSLNLTALQNPEISIVHNILMEVTKDVQNEGWHFNKEDNIKKSPDANGNYLIPNNYLRFDIHGGLYDRNRDVVKKNGKLYDNVHHTDVFTSDFYFDITYLFDFEDIPSAIQRYIIARASVRAATQIVSNSDLVKLLQLEEAKTLATAHEYDCEQGDHSFFGFPAESNYRSYQPYKALIR
ncbi:T7-like tail tubular protein A [uncultured phage MedDCM-OCT-S05-C429]|nr:T7-like tail tubular protein A [uncultured phage MedDCM-OCT-S05-C429]